MRRSVSDRWMIALCILFTAALAASRLAPIAQHDAPPAAQAAPAPAMPLMTPAAIMPVSVAALATRPLFSATRRPTATPVAVPVHPSPVIAIAPPRPPTPQLLGVIFSQSGRMAILRDPQAGHPSHLGEHDHLGAWKVIEITPTSVRLSAGGTETTLVLGTPTTTDARPGQSASPPVMPPPPRRPPLAAS